MWDKSSWPERALAIWALTIASVGMLFVAVSISGLISENSANVASWVQAIGSIVAIASGAGCVYWQMRRQQKDAENLRVGEVQMIYGIIFHCRMAAGMVEHAIRNESRPGPVLELAYWLGELGKLPPLSMPDVGTQRMVGQLVVRLSLIDEMRRTDQVHADELVEHASQIFAVGGIALTMLAGWLAHRQASTPGMGFGFGGRFFGPVAPDGAGLDGTAMGPLSPG